MSARLVQNSFVGGELSPALYGRHDVEAYYKGAALLRNLIVLPTGGARKRPGFAPGHSWEIPAHTGEPPVRLVPYRWSRDDGGLLILTEEADGKDLRTRAAYLPKKDWTSPSAAPKSALLPAHIWPPSVRWTQVGDTLILSGYGSAPVAGGPAPQPAPAVGVLVNHPEGSLEAALYEVRPPPDAPYGMLLTPVGEFIVSQTSVRARTLHYAAYAVTGGVQSEAVKGSLANTDAEWPINCAVEVSVRVSPDAAGDWPDEVVIAKRFGALYGELARIPAGDFDSEEVETFLDGRPDVHRRIYLFRDENHLPGAMVYRQTPMFADGAPVAAACCAVYQQRLAFAGLPGEPFSLAFSRSGDLRSFHASRPVAQDDPFRMTLASGSPADVRHAVPWRDSLLLLTDAGAWRVGGSLSGEGFGPSTCRAMALNDIAADERLPPVQTTDGVLFVGADGRTVYELRYDLSQDAVTPTDRSILADHLTEGRRVVSVAHQRHPVSVVWFLLDDGTLAAMTYQPEHRVVAWSRHALDGLGESLAQIVSPGTVTGAQTDLALLRVSALEGGGALCSLGVMDASSHEDFTGEPVAAALTTLRPELPDRNVQGVRKNVTDCLVRVRGTARLSVESAAGGVTPVLAEPAGGGPFTGDVKFMPRGAINDDGQMTLRSDAGPCEIQEIVFRVEF